MNDKEKLLKVLQDIGADCFESNDEYCNRIIVRNENYDVEGEAFIFKFDKDANQYFE